MYGGMYVWTYGWMDGCIAIANLHDLNSATARMNCIQVAHF